MTHVALIVLFGLLLLPGLAMAFIPLMPAFWYLLASAAVFGILDGFTHLTPDNFAVLAGVFALSIVVDWSAGLLGAKFGGAAGKSLAYGALGGILGLLALPPFGAFIGLFAGVLIGELIRNRNHGAAVRAASGALIGSLAGVGVNVALALAFIVLFVVLAIG